jgi:cation diffusion facilitator CzcD-associated flavoprotein CzcO
MAAREPAQGVPTPAQADQVCCHRTSVPVLRPVGGRGLRRGDQPVGDQQTYLGVATHRLPNLFMVTGPQSPSVLCNMPVSIEQHVDWIAGCIRYMEHVPLVVDFR